LILLPPPPECWDYRCAHQPSYNSQFLWLGRYLSQTWVSWALVSIACLGEEEF
jgi:hypothetical protein